MQTNVGHLLRSQSFEKVEAGYEPWIEFPPLDGIKGNNGRNKRE
jgi:hypothetical protein